MNEVLRFLSNRACSITFLTIPACLHSVNALAKSDVGHPVHFSIERASANLEDAEFVFLGESHRTTQTLANAAVLRDFAQPGDIVLLEGYESLTEVPFNGEGHVRYFLRANGNARSLRIMGWDHLADYDEIESLVPVQKGLLMVGTIEEAQGVTARLNELHKVRDQTLVSTLEKVRPLRKPKGKVWVLGGINHFISETTYSYLHSQKYIQFAATESYKLTPENAAIFYEPVIETFAEFTSRAQALDAMIRRLNSQYSTCQSYLSGN